MNLILSSFELLNITHTHTHTCVYIILYVYKINVTHVISLDIYLVHKISFLDLFWVHSKKKIQSMFRAKFVDLTCFSELEVNLQRTKLEK